MSLAAGLLVVLALLVVGLPFVQWRPTAPAGPPRRYFDVVGESFHRKELGRLVGTRKRDGVNIECEGDLVLEDGNPHDPQAVRVEARGFDVGHLSRADARAFRAQLRASGRIGIRTPVRVSITAGFRKSDGTWADYSVSVELPEATRTTDSGGSAQ